MEEGALQFIAKPGWFFFPAVRKVPHGFIGRFAITTEGSLFGGALFCLLAAAWSHDSRRSEFNGVEVKALSMGLEGASFDLNSPSWDRFCGGSDAEEMAYRVLRGRKP